MAFVAFMIAASIYIFPPLVASRKVSIPEQIDEIVEEMVEFENESKRY
jgi:hypothetical protein